MGGKSSLMKGKQGEREAIKLLQPVINEVFTAMDMDIPQLQRNTIQSDKGGFDIVGLDWLALEIKRCETLAIDAWWAQAVRQAGKDKTPVLLFRQNGKREWRCILWGLISTQAREGDVRNWTQVRCEISEADFLAWFRRRLHSELV